MSPDRHAVFATLYPTTQKILRDAAMGGGVPIDDLVNALLARDVPRSPTYEKALADIAAKMRGAFGEHFESDLAKLADTWPQPEQPTPIVVVSGATIRDGKREEFDAAAIAHARSIGRSFPTYFNFRPLHAVEVRFLWPWQDEAIVDNIPVTPEDAAALLPLLVIDEPPTMVLVSGGTLKAGADDALAREVEAYNAGRDGFSKKLVLPAVLAKSTPEASPTS